MSIKSIAIIAASAMLSGCYSMQGPPQIMRSGGVVNRETVIADSTNERASLIRRFQEAAFAAIEDTPGIARLDRINTMLTSGFTLNHARCNDFFWAMGKGQTRARVIRDSIGPLVSVLTGAIALSNVKSAGRQQDYLEAIALGAAAVNSSLDIYQTNFLFGADNIDAVRKLTLDALAAHRAEGFAQAPTTFDAAAIILIDNHSQCAPPHILALTRQAITAGKVTASTNQSGGIPAADFVALSQLRAATGSLSATIDQFGALWWLIKADPTPSEIDLIATKLAMPPLTPSPLTGTSPNQSLDPNWPALPKVTEILGSLSATTRASLARDIARYRETVLANQRVVDDTHTAALKAFTTAGPAAGATPPAKPAPQPVAAPAFTFGSQGDLSPYITTGVK